MSDRQELIAAFERFLTEAPQAGDPVPEAGLAQFFTELAALRTEVRSEARQFSRAVEDYRRLLKLLEREQQQYGQRLKTVERDCLKPLLLDLVDLRERLAAGIDALSVLRPGWLVRLLCKRRRLAFEGVREGQRLTLARFDQMLAALEVTPLQTVGKAFDPALMRAAEIVHLRQWENGRVTAEVRRGWLWRGEVLCLAEVKVNKLPQAS